jgi:hypothetical protein
MISLVRFGRSSLHRSTHSFGVVVRCASAETRPRFVPSQLDEIEDVEEYRPGFQYSLILIGDLFSRGRHRIIHKLGFGSSSTIWLARDRLFGKKDSDRVVTLKAKLKALGADISSKPISKQLRIILSCAVRMTPTYFSSPRLPV